MQITFKAFNFIQLMIGSHVYSSPPPQTLVTITLAVLCVVPPKQLFTSKEVKIVTKSLRLGHWSI